jgi:hypothetical protein
MPHKDPEAAKAYRKAYYEANKEKQKAYHKEYARKNREHLRCYNLQRNYGITMAEKVKMLAAQGGVCACCGTSKPGGREGYDWHTDHIHGTKTVRGILCTNCNSGIGKLGDDLAGITDAVHYLSKSEPTLFPGIWKRIAPKISNSISAPFGQETLSGCSDNKSLSEIGSASTVVQMTI